MNPLVKAKLKNTGRIVEVYKCHNGKWVDYADCETEYDKLELIFKP